MTDVSLLQRVAKGDNAAVKACIDHYGGLVWSIVRRFSRGDETEDAVQEIFVDVWKSAARFDPAKSSEKTFVVMIARRRMIDRLRRVTRQPTIESIDDVPEVSGETHHDIELKAEAALAAKVLDQLSPEQRKVIQLSIREGMSHGEIAQATGLPVGTVKSHIRRGLNRIREQMQRSPRATDGEE